MDIRPIRTETDYDWALREIEAYFSREPQEGTPESDRFHVLASLIDSYENANWPILPADPIDTIKAVLDDRGLTQADLAALLGSRSRASEILNRKRPLTLEMIQRLAAEWHIPAEALIAPYPLRGAA